MTDHTRTEAREADGPLFPLGRTVATPGAVEVLTAGGGDWRFNAAVYLVPVTRTATGATCRARTPQRTGAASGTAGAS